MTATSDPVDFTPTVERFEALYRGESPLGTATGDPRPPWDIGGPQPVLVELADAGRITGSVLDAGCGTADNSLFLAGRGYEVTGFDASGTVVERARERAAALGLTVEFTVADATRLTGFDRRFDTVVDSALYHCLGDDQRQGYIDSLHRVSRPGARLHLICFSDAVRNPGSAVHYIGEAELRRVLADGWDLTELRAVTYQTALTRDHVERGATALGYQEADDWLGDFVGTDDQGRLLAPAWLVSAERR
ncbi:class I SAM-dependent methyltransferase [Streptomyces sp. DSM 44915]|uniref:Class I SAM-dependent methyltransferase n=1 Tax=Streptomyces chisholmiae TaxID=3075540 RepID=A0ABU2JMB4_9ACTN|nr:class I SAM-dependent methyltransferase [Streptomyces sp. DSM 44915]MDT0266117.1 class I SAM-dependent methyltransferase [Streptomyces sp. DSM 44915]